MSKSKITYKKFNRAAVNNQLYALAQEGYEYYQNKYTYLHDDEMDPFWSSRWTWTWSDSITNMDDYWKCKLLTLLRSMHMPELSKIMESHGVYW